VDAEHYGERGIGLCDRLEDPAIPGLREALATVLLGHVESAKAALPELADNVVADPAALLDRAGSIDSAAYSRSHWISPRTLRCSTSSGRGYGKASSSWISPRKSDFANDEAPSTGDVGWDVLAASTG
jgi:hypothetical protein